MATKSIYKSRMPFKGVFGFFCGEHMAITIPETEPLEFYSGAIRQGREFQHYLVFFMR